MTGYINPMSCYAGVLILLLGSVLPSDIPAQTEQRADIEATMVERGPISEYLFAQGTVRASNREYLTFQTSGRIAFIARDKTGMPLREGARVAGPSEEAPLGTLLAELDISRIRASLDAAEAELERAHIQAESAREKLERTRSLFDRGTVSRAALDQDRSAYDSAVALREAASARIGEVEAQFAVSRLYMPFDGVIAFMNIREGQYVSPQQFNPQNEAQAAQSAAVVAIDPSAYEVSVQLPVFNAQRVRTGQNALVIESGLLGTLQLVGLPDNGTSADFRSLPLRGRVVSVSPAIDPQDRTIRVRVALDAPDQRLLDGGHATVWIEVGRKEDALAVPLSAVFNRDGGNFVYTIDENGAASLRAVETGLLSFDGVEIVSGLSEGDPVVTRGKSRLRDGMALNMIGEGSEQ